jgi:hypothetical protein
MFRRVVLPHPDGPRTDISSPRLSSTETLFNAWTAPPSGKSNRMDKFLIDSPDIAALISSKN